MTTALGLPVPPGFTIAVDVCHTYLDTGWPDGLDAAVEQHCAALGDRLGRRFGDPADPLLLAVRSGAPRSMPGMLDTVLNLGLTPDTVDGLARVTGDAAFAWDCYRRFLRMYATTVLGCAPEALGPDGTHDDVDALRGEAERLRAAVRNACGQQVPDDPAVQLRAAVEAVFRSCGSGRAQAYRRREGIDDVPGTAVNVQAMVFGNRGTNSGTGVVFTRDPSTGEARRYGDYLPRAQGEDVVAGTAHTLTIDHLAAEMPAVWAELDATLGRLEHHYADICDVEFTIEQGRLWVLQTRVGKRSAVAAVRAAVQMAEEPDLPLSREDAVRRVGPDVRAAARHAVLAAAATRTRGEPVARGLGASPGRVTGTAVFSSDAAADTGEDAAVVLIRPETSPEDVPGMAVAVGIITATGGLVSHAAVVARGWDLPAVVGAGSLVVDEDGARTVDGRTTIRPGDVVTLDGTTGEIWLGGDPQAPEAGEPDGDAIIATALPELLRLEEWALAGLPVSDLAVEPWGMTELSSTDPGGSRLRVGAGTPTSITIDTEDPIAVAAVEAIHEGDLPRLRDLLAAHPDLAAARLGDDDPNGMSRTLLHVVTDWPGHFPNGADVVRALVDAGADVDARFRGSHTETPLHWAASSDDVAVLDALLDLGADIDAPGAVIAGGTPLADARAFGNWDAGLRLVERGATTTLTDSATLGLIDRVRAAYAAADPPTQEETDRAFWGACHGGREDCARYLFDQGADLNWIPGWEPLTPLDAARRREAGGTVAWLRARGAKSAGEIAPRSEAGDG